VGDVQAVFEVFRNGNFFLALQLRMKLQLALAAIAPQSIPQPLPAAADLKRYALIVVNEERPSPLTAALHGTRTCVPAFVRVDVRVGAAI
jgi:hypothetical protein